MAPFIALVISFVLFRVLGFFIEPLNEWQMPLRLAVAFMFIFTATAHWGKRRPGLIQMVPPSLPQPHFIVSLTGILEIAGAVGLLIPYTSKAASICLAALLIVMFPANIHAAKRKVNIAGKPVTPLLPRTILQIVFISAVIIAGWS